MQLTNTSAGQVTFHYAGTTYTMAAGAVLNFPDSDMPDTRNGPSDVTPGLGTILTPLSAQVSINLGSVAANLTAAQAYTAGTSSDWATSAPTTVKAALDRCAALLFTLHSAAIP